MRVKKTLSTKVPSRTGEVLSIVALHELTRRMPTKGRKRKASTSPSSPRKRRSESESEVSASGELSIRTTEGQTAAAEVHDLDGDEDEQDPRPTTEDNDMTMEVILAPPAHVVTGSQFRSPFVVIFKTPGVNPNENAAENQRSSFCGWWAYLSLMNEDSSTSLAPPQTGLLLGQPVAAIRPLQTPIEDQNRAFAYASWSGVTITAPGRYCLKVNAIDMQR